MRHPGVGHYLELHVVQVILYLVVRTVPGHDQPRRITRSPHDGPRQLHNGRTYARTSTERRSLHSYHAQLSQLTHSLLRRTCAAIVRGGCAARRRRRGAPSIPPAAHARPHTHIVLRQAYSTNERRSSHHIATRAHITSAKRDIAQPTRLCPPAPRPRRRPSADGPSPGTACPLRARCRHARH